MPAGRIGRTAGRRRDIREPVLIATAYEGPSAAALSDLEELAELVHSAGARVVGQVAQRRREGGPLFGSGKVAELARLAQGAGAGALVTQQSLSPSEQRRLDDVLPCRVLDRTGLILDIFAQRARSREGQLQVELAQHLYRLPRLSGKGKELSRLGGGLGTRGPGEQKLEYDRRRIRERMSRLKDEIEALRSRRAGQRDRRRERSWPLVALAGYTNAGKSTLFNALTRAGAIARGQMFSTLDPQVRQVRLPGGGRILLTDTVGFIRDLPENLRVAFRATLEEIGEADAVVHVVDASHPDAARQAASVLEELENLGVARDAVVTVLNKIDRVEGGAGAARLAVAGLDAPFPASAATGEGVESCRCALEEVLRRRFWRLVSFRDPAPGLLARLASVGASVRETTGPAGKGSLYEAWVAPAQAAALAREAAG